MDTNNNAKLIQDIYAAFGRGDVDTVASHCHVDCHWDFNVADSDVPWHVPVTGPAEVKSFIAAFVDNVEIESFEPTRFMAVDDEVLVHLRLAYTIGRTGVRVDEEQVQWWTVRGDKVSRLKHFEDTSQVVSAWREKPITRD